MEFNKQTVKALLGVVCGGIAFAEALLHLDVVAGAAGWLLGILSPLLLGCAIAFILNVPMRALERCLFPPIYPKFGAGTDRGGGRQRPCRFCTVL